MFDLNNQVILNVFLDFCLNYIKYIKVISFTLVSG